MKNFFGAILMVVLVSGVFIGCDFIDSNSPSVQLDDRNLGPKFDGYYSAAADTSGWEGPPGCQVGC